MEIVTHLLSLICLLTLTAQGANVSKQAKISDQPVLIVISFDGFRYDYISRARTPNIDSLKNDGVYAPYMKAQFVTKTFPNHMSIATGLHTESHGIIDNSVYDPQYGRNLSGFDSYNKEFWNFDPNVVPIWVLNEWAKAGRTSGAMMWPGSNHPYGANDTLQSYSVAYNHSMPFEERVDKVLSWVTNSTNPANLVFLYFEEPDENGHGFGPESAEVIQQVELMDDLTGYMIQSMKTLDIFDKVNLILLSDHGFQEIKQQNMIDMAAMVSPAFYRRYSASPTVLLDPVEGKFEEVYEALKTGSVGKNFTVYKKEELPEIWHYANNRRIPPIVLVADPGYVFDEFARTIISQNTKWNLTASPDRVYGVHGYDNRDVNMRPIFLAHGPAFKKGVEIQPFDNIDLFPLFCKLMEINPPPNNGTLANVEEMLFTSTGVAGPTGSAGILISLVVTVFTSLY